LINSGFKLAELLGIGGMGTRGFGRVRSIGGGWNATPDSLKEKEAGHA
jgi:CRISPR/Cas system CSM-associated protein Csm3 (group 7 of RAMP superfamily)